MGRNSKIPVFYDKIYGECKIEEDELKILLKTFELNRLHHLRQASLAYLFYPGMNHTRFEHSIGSLALVKRYKELHKDAYKCSYPD